MIGIYQKYIEFPIISTDTRKIIPNSLFFALKGTNFNGNIFAEEALSKGAKYAIIDEKFFLKEDFDKNNKNNNSDKFAHQKDERFILVNDVLETLQSLAAHHRRNLGTENNLKVIAVCGSNGKTTTKELLTLVLAQKYNTLCTEGNLNNHIGVPLTLLKITKSTQIAVIEMGANHAHETMQLCEIAQPDFGVITNNGLDHLEGFGSIEGVKSANAELYDYLKTTNATAFVNTLEEDLLEIATQKQLKNIITYPQKNDHFQAEITENNPFLSIVFGEDSGKDGNEKQTVKTQIIGKYNFNNIATATCMGSFFEVSNEKIAAALMQYVPSNNRSQIIQKDNNKTIILDAYNANPSSMKQAINNFAELNYHRKAVILGDMYELGIYTDTEHENLGKLVAEKRFDIAVFYGEMVKKALPHNPNAYYFSDKFSLHNWLQDKNFENMAFLVKGSRGVKLETVTEFI